MDNQHRKIAGYRELSQEDIDLMNRIKGKGAELLELQEELARHLQREQRRKTSLAFGGVLAPVPERERCSGTSEELEYFRFIDAEPHRWAAIGKTDIQTGIMALVRAVAQPAGM